MSYHVVLWRVTAPDRSGSRVSLAELAGTRQAVARELRRLAYHYQNDPTTNDNDDNNDDNNDNNVNCY